LFGSQKLQHLKKHHDYRILSIETNHPACPSNKWSMVKEFSYITDPPPGNTTQIEDWEIGGLQSQHPQ
jgi:hypothetical protein